MNRIQSYSFGATTSQPSRGTRKRLSTPSSPPHPAKRPMTGPFLTSDEEDHDDDRDDNGFEFDNHVTAAPSPSTTHDVQFSHSRNGDILPSRTASQWQRPFPAPERQSSAAKPSVPAQSGTRLNMNRLKVLMANKSGKTAIPGSPPKASAALSNRPMHGAQANGLLQKNSSDAAVDRDTFCLNGSAQTSTLPAQMKMSQQSSRSLTPSDVESDPRTSQAGRHFHLGPPLRGRTRRSINTIDEFSQAQLNRSQKPGVGNPSQRNDLKAHTERGNLTRMPNSTTSRTNATRLNNVPDSTSLRNTLEVTRAEHRAAPQVQNTVGSEWQKARVGRAAAKTVKKQHRPEVGARYGHTLTARKANAVETPTRKQGVPSSTAAHLCQPSVVESRNPSHKYPPASRNSRAQKRGLHTTLASGTATTIDRTSSPSQLDSISDPIEKTAAIVCKQNLPPAAASDKPSFSGELSSNMKTTARTPAIRTTIRKQDVQSQKSAYADKTVVEKTPGMSESSLHHHGTAGSDLEVEPRSSEEHINTRADSLSNRTIDANVAPQKPRGEAVAPLEHHSDLFAAQDMTQKMDLCQETLLTDASRLTSSSSTATEFAAQNNVPVAVMVGPSQVSDASLLLMDLADNAASVSNEVPATSLSESSCQTVKTANLMLTAVESALTGREEKEQKMPATIYTEHPISRTSRKPAQVPLLYSSHGLAPEQRFVESPGRVELASPQSDTTKLSAAVDSTHKIPQIPNSASSDRPRTVPVPEYPVSPFSLKIPQPEAPGSTSSPKPVADPSLRQSGPIPDELTDLQSPPDTLPVISIVSQNFTLATTTDFKLPSPKISSSAEPYFEYTIHQALISSLTERTTELSAQPLTSLDAANIQMERFLQTSKQQLEMLGMQCTTTEGQIDDNGLPAQKSTFRSAEDPTKAMTSKLWIERAEVGIHANRTPSTNFAPPSIGKTVYAVRLWKLLEAPNDDEDAESKRDSSDDAMEDEDKDDEDEEDGADQGHHKCNRTYHPFPPICTELHTSLDAANRAAKRVQVHLSHMHSPKTLQKQWQTQDLLGMEHKLEQLRKEALRGGGSEEDDSPSLVEYEQGRRMGCWRSKFTEPIKSGVGRSRGVCSFELLVCRVRVSGPRNL